VIGAALSQRLIVLAQRAAAVLPPAPDQSGAHAERGKSPPSVHVEGGSAASGGGGAGAPGQGGAGAAVAPALGGALDLRWMSLKVRKEKVNVARV